MSPLPLAFTFTLASASMPTSLVRTPMGAWPRECVHELPSGTAVMRTADGGVEHKFPNGSMARHLPCPRGARRQHAIAPRDDPCIDSSSGTRAHFPAPLWGNWSSGDMPAVTSFIAEYVVPDYPVTEAEQSVYIWIGVSPASMEDVIQPVLGWNKQGGTDPDGSWFGPGGWGIEAWNCCPGGHANFAETAFGLEPGDTVSASIIADAARGANAYIINATVPARPGATSVLLSDDDAAQTIPAVQLETWNECADDDCAEVHCDMLPGSAIAFSKLEIEPAHFFYTYTADCWDLRDRCAWGAELAADMSSWTLTPPSA